MQPYIAFLRGINVGGHTVKMAELRTLFEALGLANVATFIASGNVIFFHCHEREIYWLCRTKLSESPLFSGSLLTKVIGVPSTMRNATTVKKLAAKYPAHR